MNQPIYDVVTATLAELGMPTPAAVIQTMLMQDGYFVGWKFRYDGGHAIFRAGDNAVAFYADDGTVLKTVAADAAKGVAA